MILILIGPGAGFPNGTATTVRTMLYARGLRAQGHDVRVLCLSPSESPAVGVLNHAVSGVAEGIEFEYTGGTTLRGTNPLQQLWRLVEGIAMGLARVIACGRGRRVEAVLFYSHRSVLIPPFWLASRLCGAPFLLESCEEPFHEAAHRPLLSWALGVYTHALYRFFDGAIVISAHLERYVRRRLRRGTRLLRIPILVDPAAFSDTTAPRPVEGPYVAYSGTLNETKDGVLTLMKAFRTVSEERPDLRLVLVGDSYVATQIPAFRRHAEDLGIAERVIFTGLLPRDRLPPYLAHAEVLALARPSSRQAEAGFPTKLGEYLATGKPVVVTNVGEIGEHLVDGRDIFLAPPDDLPAFTGRLRYVLAHPDVACEVGRRGQETARRSFSYLENGRRLSEFIRGLSSARG